MKSRILRTALLLAAALAIVFLPSPTVLFPRLSAAPPAHKVLRVEAGEFAFTPAVLQVNPGDQVTIELVATDVSHGLSIDGYTIDLHADPGQTARATFIATRAGSFKMRCSIACGNLHPFMTGRFEVGPNQLLFRAAGLALLAAIAGITWRRGG
jgi:heme/copper-type cytochrome/quinol oxidase subunit 2